MRIRSMFHTFVALMAVLTFSMPFITLAQQNSVRTEVSEAAAAHDINAVNLEARAAAERDANNDINKFLWFGVGLGACIGPPAGGLAGCVVGNSIDPIESSGLFFFDVSGAAMLGGCVGVAAGVAPFIWAFYKYHQSQPPSERLIGKSPEYVEFYTDVYRAKTRSLRKKYAARGAATPIGLMMIASLIIRVVVE